ncbi:hypothetical protein [Methylomonas albis]|nr:hypothetical protein [Methylomonas albis]
MGRLFARHNPESIEALNVIEKIPSDICRSAKLFYLQTDTVYMLAIKHYQQLSYDLAGLWLTR